MISKVGSLIFLIGIIASVAPQLNNFQSANPTWASMNARSLQSPTTIPFPQCIQTSEATQVFQPNVIEQLFLQKLQEEDSKLKQERSKNLNLKNSQLLKKINCSFI